MRRNANGFSLIEVAVVVAVLAIILALVIPLMSGLADADRSNRGYSELIKVHAAIVGVPTAGDYGYIGDVGDYPVSLMDLVRNPGLEGWNGPYLVDAVIDANTLLDTFGSPIEYFFAPNAGAVADRLAVISPGPDRGSNNISPTPNVWTSYSGTPPPTDSSYYIAGGNADNVVFPRFTDDAGLLGYNNVGHLNVNIFNFDSNPAILRFVPACPNLFDIKVTSAARPSDTWGTDAADTTPTYNPGGASFDLIQGVYRVQIRHRAAPNGVVWDEIVAIAPGSNQTRNYSLPGPDSSLTSNVTLNATNNLAANVTIYSAGTSVGTAASGGGTSGALAVKACSHITVRQTANGALVDSFIMPIGLSSYLKVYDTATYTYTLTNNSGTYRYLFVYLNGVLLGEVSGWGKFKIKSFGGLKNGDQLDIKDQTGFAPVSTVTISGDGGMSL